MFHPEHDVKQRINSSWKKYPVFKSLGNYKERADATKRQERRILEKVLMQFFRSADPKAACLTLDDQKSSQEKRERERESEESSRQESWNRFIPIFSSLPRTQFRIDVIEFKSGPGFIIGSVERLWWFPSFIHSWMTDWLISLKPQSNDDGKVQKSKQDPPRFISNNKREPYSPDPLFTFESSVTVSISIKIL